MKTFRSILSRRAVSALAGVVLAGSAQAAPTIKIGTVVWAGYGPFYVADQLDMYKKSGFKVQLQVFNDPALVTSSITSGAIDGGMITYDQAISAVARGSTMKVVMPIDYSNGGDAVVATNDITSLSQLKGLKVAYNPLSPSDFLISYALSTVNLHVQDIEPVAMPPESVTAAMASGGVKVGVTYEPSVSEIVKMGEGKKFHVLYSSKDAPGLITDVMTFNADYIAKHPAEVKAVIQGYVDGLAYMKAHPAEAAKLIGKALGIPAEEVAGQLSGVYNPTLEEFSDVFGKSDKTTSLYVSGKVISDILKAKGEIETVPATEDTMDASIAAGMLKQ